MTLTRRSKPDGVKGDLFDLARGWADEKHDLGNNGREARKRRASRSGSRRDKAAGVEPVVSD